MEVSALRYSGGIGLHGRSPLLRLQSDERLVAFVRRGSAGAFETLVARYQSRLLAFCRHMLGSREDAEDVLQEVFAAAFNAILADERPINVRPWLYRIARNRSLNHLRRMQAVGVDSMDVHLFEHGASTADKVHEREEFRMLVDDIQELPETQRTALVLREMDALSYEQIADAMETTVPSVKSLLVRARVSLAEASEARLLSCEEVRIQLGEVAEGLQRRPSALVRRHLRACKRCSVFRAQLRETNKALTALLPVGPFVVLRKLAVIHLGHSAGAGTGATGAGATGSTAAAGTGAVVGSTASGLVSAGIGTIATKAAAGLAAAALVTAGAVEVSHVAPTRPASANIAATRPSPALPGAPQSRTAQPAIVRQISVKVDVKATRKPMPAKRVLVVAVVPKAVPKASPKPAVQPVAPATAAAPVTPAADPGRTQHQTDSTVLGAPASSTSASTNTTPGGTSDQGTPTSGVPAGTTGNPSGDPGPGSSGGGAANGGPGDPGGSTQGDGGPGNGGCIAGGVIAQPRCSGNGSIIDPARHRRISVPPIG